MPRADSSHEVYIERGDKRVFAGALEWPGWCRGGRDEDLALEALAAYGHRFAHVVRRRVPGFRVPDGTGDLMIFERLTGNATTDFGASSKTPAIDRRPIGARELARLGRCSGRAGRRSIERSTPRPARGSRREFAESRGTRWTTRGRSKTACRADRASGRSGAGGSRVGGRSRCRAPWERCGGRVLSGVAGWKRRP
jgi:hypothetical protein